MRCRLASCLSIGLCLVASAAVAQPSVVPYAGYNLGAGYDNGASYLALRTDDLDTRGGFVLGVGADVPVLRGRFPFGLSVRPSVETAVVPGEAVTFGGGGSIEFSQRFWQASLMLFGDVPLRSPVVPYLGFGLTYARYSADFDAAGGAALVGPASVSAWAIAPNLAAGLRFERGRVAPLVEARYRFATPSPDFSAERPGADIDNGLSVVVGARVAL
jgi:opacity protein-like surface antigen